MVSLTTLSFELPLPGWHSGCCSQTSHSTILRIRIDHTPDRQYLTCQRADSMLTMDYPKNYRDTHNNFQITVVNRRSRDLDSSLVRVGVSVFVLEQSDVASRDPVLKHTHWESWIQTSDEFFKIWSGRVGDILDNVNKIPSQ